MSIPRAGELSDATANTELATPVAAADNLANPTVPQVIAHGVLWSPAAAVWVRQVDSVNAEDAATTTKGIPPAFLLGRGAGNVARALTMAPVSGDGDTANGVLAVHPMLHNGSSYDHQRNNLEATLLAANARTAEPSIADQVNYNGRGVLLYLSVTANPNNGDTLQIALQWKDPASGNYVNLAAPAASALGGVAGRLALLYYPGAGVAAGAVPTGCGLDAQYPGVLPRTWRPRVIHSGSGAWTYALGATILN